MERLEFLQAQTIPDLGGLVFSGTCNAGMVASTTSIVAADLAGYGDSFFNGKYYMQVIKNANSVGNAPEREVRAISAYTSTTGTFTTSAFTVNVEASDNIMVVHESLIMSGRDDADNAMATTNVVANADGSIVERQEYLQAQVASVKSAITTENTWYADSSVSVSGAGASWGTAFKTIAEAVTAASAGDVINIRGEFDEGAAITLSKELHLIGQNTSSNQNNTLIYSNGAYPLILVKANQCKIHNIGFAQQAAQNTITIGDDPGQAWWKLHIKDCKFDGYATSLIGVANGSAADAPDLHIEGCLFRSFATGCISTNTTRARINDNLFIVSTATYGITHVPNTGDRPDTMIINNKFITPDAANAVGVTVTNTPTVGLFLVTENKFVNFADNDHCISKRTGYTGLNYLGITAIAIT